MTTQVIIIGGGISGLTACTELLKNGIEKIYVIEGLDRLGGRINTIDFGNSYIELGAQWIHGQKNNPIYELCKSLDLVDDVKLKANTNFYSTQDGCSIDENYYEKYFKKFQEMLSTIEDYIEDNLNENSEKTLEELFNKIFEKFIRQLNSDDTNKLELLKSIFKCVVYEEYYNNACDDLNDINAFGWNEYEHLEGEYLTRTKYGYKKLIEYFSSQIPKNLIKLNEKVLNIDWSAERVRVSTKNSLNNENNVYEADVVLCTIPLGCLKRNMHEMFYPSLPEAKQNAITKLGFGTANKIFLIFDKPILRDYVEGLQIVWRDDISDCILDDSIIQKWNLDENNKFYKCLNNYMVLPNMPNVILIFTVGKDAIFIENLEEECLNDIVFDLLTKCFPKLSIPRPRQILKSGWNSHEFSRGSYSYFKAGSTLKDLEEFAEPLENKVFFSGEATTAEHIGTVHGAYTTGLKAAKDIIKNLS